MKDLKAKLEELKILNNVFRYLIKELELVSKQKHRIVDLKVNLRRKKK